MYIGNFAAAQTIRKAFNTEDGTGAAVTLLGSPAVAIYKDGSLTQVTTGATLTVDYDGVTGLNMLIIDTSSDGTFYASGSDYKVVLSAGTIAGVSVVGKLLVEFSIDNRLSKLSTGIGTGQIELSSGTVAVGAITSAAGNAIAERVTDEALSGHTTAGSLGKTLSDVLVDTAYMQPRVPATGTLATTADVGTTQPRVNKPAAPAYRLKISSMADGTYKCTKPIRLRPGELVGTGIPVGIDMSPQFGDTFVETVGTPTVSGGSLTADDLGPRDTEAMITVDGTATASESRTITVPVTMETGETVSVTFDVKVFAE
jgi:hypothetical protein